MAHNVSQEKQEAEARRRRRAELAPLLGEGWLLTYDNKLQAVDTPAGYHVRGQRCLLTCERRECRRRLELDLLDAIRGGLGDTPIDHVADKLRCGHWAGCQFRISDRSYPLGLPLCWFVFHPGAVVVLVCKVCHRETTMEPANLIRRLKRSGAGDGGTGLHQLPQLVRRPCAGCRRKDFGVDWRTPPAPGTPNYRGPK